MKTHVEFRSNAFPPYKDEVDEINPGRFGKRIAEFLIRGLKQQGIQPSEPVAEDWGWTIRIPNQAFPLWIGCGNYDEYPDGFLCFIEPHQPTIWKFLFFGRIDTTGPVTALRDAIDEVLSAEPAVIDKRWWTYDEFKNLVRQ